MQSIFEQMGGTYRQEGDYLLPNLELPDTTPYPIGKYGRLRKTYLKSHHPGRYNAMSLNGTLHQHLSEILRPQMETQAKERIRDAMSSGKVGFWNFQLSIKDADKLLGEVGMAEQREHEKRQEERKISYQSQHRSKEHDHAR